MPNLTIEDGSMPEGANSYASIANCDTWQGQRGFRNWPAPPEDEAEPDPNLAAKESALILACDYLNGLAWKGRRAAAGRVMAWPRVEVVDGDGYEVTADTVPQNVVYAQCYLAGLAYGETDLQPVLERGGRIQTEKVGSLATTYFDDARDRDVFTVLSDLLGGLAVGLGGEQGQGQESGGGFSVIEVVRG